MDIGTILLSVVIIVILFTPLPEILAIWIASKILKKEPEKQSCGDDNCDCYKRNPK